MGVVDEGAADERLVPFKDESLKRWFDPKATYYSARFAILRLLGLVYLVAFTSIARQAGGLIGARGLEPAQDWLARVARAEGGAWGGFWRLPSIFWITGADDGAVHAVCVAGAILSFAVMLGVTNAMVQLVLWALYMSIVHVGQTFYGFGWEFQLLETGFLAIFLCPIRSVVPVPSTEPPVVVIWLFRWLIVRIMLGAGLIKLRGDPCWGDLTCLVYHYETQPIPSPLSWLFHAQPVWAQKIGALFNFVVELGAPLITFSPRPYRHVAGVLFVVFQVTLIASGNLSFLNWLTLVPALACFDDRAFARVLPRRLRARLEGRPRAPAPRAARIASYVLLAVVGILSVAPVANLMSPRQVMNTSFEPLHLVNTYGAFGSVGRTRDEVILEGTSAQTIDEATVWREYELPCKPGDVHRTPCLVTPYHYRLDWQTWFAAMASYEDEPWLVHLVYELLRGEPSVKTLLAKDPFPDAPPRWIRIELYRYEMNRFADPRGWWRRRRLGEYMRPVRVDDPDLLAFLKTYGFRLPDARGIE